MIGLIIAITIICIILILLCSSLKIVLKISDGVVFRISFLGITVFSLDNDRQLKKEDSTEKKKITTVLKEYTKGKKNAVENILSVLKELCVKFGLIVKHLRFKKLEFDLTVATSDAATTAIAYGGLCSLVYSISGMLSSAYHFDAKKIQVSADFSAEQMNLRLNSVLKIRVVFLVRFTLSAALSIIKMKLGEVKNGRT